MPFNTSGNGLLVVEGFINLTGKTSIALSRTTKLNDKRIVPETGALLLVEGEDNSSYFLNESFEGTYVTDPLPFNSAVKYRLRIKTKNNKEYLSEFKSVIVTPSIDSLSWKREDGGVQIYVNSHDPENSTHYYKWDYEETWEFKSSSRASLKFKILEESGDKKFELAYYDSTTYSVYEKVYTCWQNSNSTEIEIGSTIKQVEDVVAHPVRFHRKGAWELSFLYSILVKQYGLSEEGFDFFQRMKKNSESLGSIFDAQPSEITGNIQCVTDPGEPVIGYIEFTSLEEKRFFISNNDLPDWEYDPDCQFLIAVGLEFPYLNDPEVLKTLYIDHGYVPTIPFELAMGSNYVISFYADKERCVDCTVRGYNTKPSFWP